MHLQKAARRVWPGPRVLTRRIAPTISSRLRPSATRVFRAEKLQRPAADRSPKTVSPLPGHATSSTQSVPHWLPNRMPSDEEHIRAALA